MPSNSDKLHLLSKLITWIFTNLLFLLLKIFFYITDTTFLRYKLLYFRQVTWNKLHLRGLVDLRQRNILKPVSEKYVRQLFQAKSSLGISTLRFLPKQKSLRPIINMGVVNTELTNQNLSVNKQLTDLHLTLTFLKDNNPSLIGHGKLGMDDVFAAWKGYVGKWWGMSRPRLYFVKTDITNCYDSMIQEKMYTIMENLLKEEMSEDEEYIVRRYVTLKVCRGVVRRKFHRVVTPMYEYEPDFVNYAKNLIGQGKSHDVIMVDKVVYQHLTQDFLLKLLRLHLYNNIVKVGSRFYRHSQGISQGSIISTLLCSFYYADMERRWLDVHDEDLLIRIVDDYLFVSPSLESATKFLQQMLDGIAEYNCHTNKEKVLTNFQHGHIPMVNSAWFPWCGVIFNMQTLELGTDYSRYIGTDIVHTMTFDLSRHPGTFMKDKLLFSVRQKCQSIYLDGTINSCSHIFTNIYLVFLLTACKFHAYAVKFPTKQRVEQNPNYFIGMVYSLAGLVWSLVQAQDNAIQDGKQSIKWLCLSAFSVKLSKHHSLYKCLLGHLRVRREALQKDMSKNQVDLLQKLTYTSVPYEFTCIMS